LTELERLGQWIRRDRSFFSSLAGENMHPSVHASVIEGGQGWSSYPDRCLLRLERRMIPGERGEDVEAELDEILTRLAREDPQFRAVCRLTFVRQAWQASEGPVLRALERACIVESGSPPRRASGLMWTDAAIMEEAGIPTVVFGPQGEGKHAMTEWVDIDSVVACARILAGTAIEFCNQSQ
jgi:acetylornithine deacetylase